ncbi:MAG TPA: 3-oxoacyl-[acyl-carrier-protein] synthase III C-terminal domain-containing protein [Longimicrobium sp.]|jgi:3-oxoacyl-[acyl-carrier-protein] synthase-3
MDRPVGLLGLGHAVPPHVRHNDDPVFSAVRGAARHGSVAEAELFTGMRERRFLAPGEAIEELMVQAGRQALAQAGVDAARVDRLYGYASVSEYLAPNGLFQVHAGLGLPRRAMVVPVNNEFSNFITSCILAWEAIAAGHCEYALVTCGSAWSRNMDYELPHALVVGDGAGAALLGPSARMRLVGHAAESSSGDYHVMGMKARVTERANGRRLLVDASGLPVPTYEIGDQGVRAFLEEGMSGPPRLVQELFHRHDVDPAEVTLVTHQASRALLAHWGEQVRPAKHLDTFEALGNMGLASIPVTLAQRCAEVTTPYLAMVSLGPGTHITALLVQCAADDHADDAAR